MARENRNKNTNAGETSKRSTPGNRTKPLKPEPKILKKSPSRNTKSAKGSEGSRSNQKKNQEANNNDKQKKGKNQEANNNDKQNKGKNQEANNNDKQSKGKKDFAANDLDKRNKGKTVANNNESKKTSFKSQNDERGKKNIDGMIFMCNAKTKPDCFRYMVLGLPGSKIDIVSKIKPGQKLFLYDFDAKLLYGIYRATSNGGMRLEPAAFGGNYPAQVRFEVHSDCVPLSEGKFKKAIMGDSGGDKVKFDSDLSRHEVNKLMDAFRPANQLKPNIDTFTRTPQQIPIPLVPMMPMIQASETSRYLSYPETFSAAHYAQPLIQKETVRETAPRDPFSLSEKEYRTYGLRRESLPAPAPVPALGMSHPVDAYYSYDLPSSRTAYLPKLESHNDLSYRRTEGSEYRFRPAETASYLGNTSGSSRWSETEYGARAAEADRLHSAHAAIALSDYTRSYLQPGGAGDPGTLSVSSRYSFAGPSFTYR